MHEDGRGQGWQRDGGFNDGTSRGLRCYLPVLREVVCDRPVSFIFLALESSAPAAPPHGRFQAMESRLPGALAQKNGMPPDCRKGINFQGKSLRHLVADLFRCQIRAVASCPIPLCVRCPVRKVPTYLPDLIPPGFVLVVQRGSVRFATRPCLTKPSPRSGVGIWRTKHEWFGKLMPEQTSVEWRAAKVMFSNHGRFPCRPFLDSSDLQRQKARHGRS